MEIRTSDWGQLLAALEANQRALLSLAEEMRCQGINQTSGMACLAWATNDRLDILSSAIQGLLPKSRKERHLDQ